MSVAQITLEELKTALRLDNKTITDWVRGLRNPKGETIDRTNVYHALQTGTPKWLLKEINDKIRSSHRKYPTYYKDLTETNR
ncbi:hypothetical protein [Fodinibius sp.]|uniref:hypothetical protein n=1 Tax=Fodinibius sp. TaxID=1872440 RepID=UPI002ACED23C|nr:hypothetical protein [Fodinibius sp.]MDZ7657996.1 hypothetical protein [Fodinibius sp.]